MLCLNHMNKKVIYWCSRAIRLYENPALELAYETALKNNCELEVHFFALKDFKYANARNMHFLLNGLLELSKKLKQLNIPLLVHQTSPLLAFNEIPNIHTIVTEQASLRFMRNLQEQVKAQSKKQSVEFYRVNTATVVPIHIASDKCEYAARTIRPKLLRQYKQFLNKELKLIPLNQSVLNTFDESTYNTIYQNYREIYPQPIDWLIPGEDAAHKQLNDFILDGLNRYHLRNEVNANATSFLSPYLHFGMISPRTIVRKVLESKSENAETFIEQVLVRRELAENYCFYQDQYDKLDGAWSWAIKTLKEHEDDVRENIYPLTELENSRTDDNLWNYCQDQVREKGYLHGYLRMYWAKQVLYWSHNAQEALDKLIYLNDTFMLDGRDPNGYVGIMWSIAGVHDRPWFNKEVFGLVRTMSKKGTLKKSKLKLKE